MRAGAQLYATHHTITAVQVTGVEVKDDGSSLKLTECSLRRFSERDPDSEAIVRGVNMRSRSSATLVGVSITCPVMFYGVAVCTRASAILEDVYFRFSTCVRNI